jgi:hypothetical protein
LHRPILHHSGFHQLAAAACEDRRQVGQARAVLLAYCKDDDRRRTYPNEKFDFLGYTFRPRRSKNRKGKYFINFSPAVSDEAVKAIRAEIRSWNLHLRSDKRIEDLSRMFNPIIRPRQSVTARDFLPHGRSLFSN